MKKEMFEKSFCSSPWFHMRITNSGEYQYCRWAPKNSTPSGNIKQQIPIQYFQQDMAKIRKQMLEGHSIDSCKSCHVMEEHGKVSGRQKQLLKTGVLVKDFTKTMLSSPWVTEWTSSQDKAGRTEMHVQDWQIDLGNFCNSACVYCHPNSSSRLASEFFKLNLISELPARPWCDDPDLLDKFINTLKQSPSVQYIHFIGGETLITPAFEKILQVLINQRLNEKVTIGFTTNLTLVDAKILNLLDQFNQVNLGVSLECLDRVNDYVRFGSEITQVKNLLKQWTDISKKRKWFMQIRTTPTALTVSRLWSVYEYAWENEIAVESCNFIDNPVFMRPSVLPQQFRQTARDNLETWIKSKSSDIQSEQIINIRHPNFVQQQILQDAMSYVNYLDQEPDLSSMLPNLAGFLKILDTNRNICVLDYLPEYEELFRSAGY